MAKRKETVTVRAWAVERNLDDCPGPFTISAHTYGRHGFHLNSREAWSAARRAVEKFNGDRMVRGVFTYTKPGGKNGK